MKVTAIKPFYVKDENGKRVTISAGQSAEVPNALGRDFIRRGRAKAATEKAEKPKKAAAATTEEKPRKRRGRPPKAKD